MRLLSRGLLAAAALFVSLAPEAVAQAPTVVKFPGGPDVFPGPPGQFSSLINSYVQWSVVLDNTRGTGEIVFNYFDIMDPAGVRSCSGAACFGADQMELLCDPPYAPNLDGGTLVLCDPPTGILDIDTIRVPAGSTSCVQFWTRILPGARGTGGVQNIGCVEIVSPLPMTTETRPTTSPTPACSPMPASGNVTACSILNVPNIEPPSFTNVKSAVVEDVNLNGVNDVGDIITWRVDVTNTGTEAHDGWLFDPYPAGTTFLDILENPDAACAARLTDIDCDVLSFGPGETKTLRFRSTIDCSIITTDDTSAACNTAFICNDAGHATCAPSDEDTALPPTATCVPVPLPDLTASTKTWQLRDDNDGDGALSAGDRVAFTVIVRNDGTGTANDVVVTDPIDTACLDETTIFAGAGGYDSFTDVLTWNIPTIAPGGFEQNEFTALILDDTIACCNQAFLSYPELAACSIPGVPTDDPAAPGAVDSTCVSFGPQPLLRVEKDFTITQDADGDGEPDAGDELTFTITVRNDGAGVATDVAIDDLLIPCWDQFSVASMIITGEGTNESTELAPPMTPNRVRVTGIGGADGLAPLGAEIVTITFPLVYEPGTLPGCCNVADATYAESAYEVHSDDPSTGFQGDQTCTTRTSPPAQLELAKTWAEDVADGCVQPGENVTFTIAVTARTTAAQLIQLRDDITDLGSSFEVVNANGGTVEPGGDAITWDFGDVAPDATRLQTWIGRFACDALTGATIDDVASAVAINAPSAVSAPVTTTVSAPDLVLTQVFTTVDADASGTLTAGDTAIMTITLENQGGCAAPLVVITLPLDPDLDAASRVVDGSPNLAAGVLTWDSTTTPELASLAAGSSVTYAVQATVLDPLTNPDPAKDGILEFAPAATAESPFVVCPIQVRAPVQTKVISVSAAQLVAGLRAIDDDQDACWESGELVVFEVSITPTGGAGADVVAVLTLDDPSGILTVTDDGGGTQAGPPVTITWNLGDLPADVPVIRRVTVLVRCDAPGGLTFGAMLDATSSNLPPAQAVVGPLTTTAPDLQVTKQFTWGDDDGDFVVDPGEIGKFEITVRNNGTCQLRNVSVLDAIDPDLDLSNITMSPTGTDDGSGGLSWDGLGFNPGSVISLTVEVPVLDPATNVNGNGLIDNEATALATSSFGCPAIAFYAQAAQVEIGRTVGVWRMLRNDFITCRQDALQTMRTFMRERPAPQECSEPPAIDPAHRGTQVVGDAVSPLTFAGDANPASSFGQCPQTLVGFGRILVFYELDDPQPFCVTSLRVRKAGPDVEVSW